MGLSNISTATLLAYAAMPPSGMDMAEYLEDIRFMDRVHEELERRERVRRRSRRNTSKDARYNSDWCE